MSWRQALETYIRREAKPVDKYAHQPRLYRLVRALGQGMQFDDDVLHAAVWLHDLGVFVGHRPEDQAELSRWDHIAYVEQKAPDLLRKLGFPEAKIPAVLEAIRTHLPNGEPTTPEGVLLREADILEQLGAVGILRTVSKVGRDTRFATHGAAVESLAKALHDLPGKLRLERAREMAAPRVQSLEVFLAAARTETTGEL
jgi:uncharacterized protein